MMVSIAIFYNEQNGRDPGALKQEFGPQAAAPSAATRET